MRIKAFLILAFSILCSCEESKLKKEYYQNGIIKKEWYENNNGQLEGERKDYYPNGKLSSKAYWSNDSLDGELIDYYPNGNIKGKGNYESGKRNGLFILYYENGKVRQKSFWVNGIKSGEGVTFFPDSLGGGIEREYFINYRGKETSTGWVSYNKDGTIYDESRRVHFINKSDTISLGESFEIVLELRKPRFSKTQFILGNYDNRFYLTDSTSLDTIEANNQKVKLKLTPKQKGANYIRGHARNYELLDSGYYKQVNPVYFEKKYFVK